MKCSNCGAEIIRTIHGAELCKVCAVKAKWTSEETPDNRKSKEVSKLNVLVKQMLGHRMTKEQLAFQDVLRVKVKAKEITVEEGHRLWKEKFGEE